MTVPSGLSAPLVFSVPTVAVTASGADVAACAALTGRKDVNTNARVAATAVAAVKSLCVGRPVCRPNCEMGAIDCVVSRVSSVNPSALMKRFTKVVNPNLYQAWRESKGVIHIRAPERPLRAVHPFHRLSSACHDYAETCQQEHQGEPGQRCGIRPGVRYHGDRDVAGA